MIKKTPKKYTVELNEELMRDLIKLIHNENDNNPFLPLEVWRFNMQLDHILRDGCFKHNILRESFRVSPNETITLCRLCNPKEYKKLKVKR